MPLAMVVVALYVVVTAPLLYLVLRVHSLQSDYTRLFMAALILQIIPIGLVFFPLGFIGVVLLLASLVATWRRNWRFRAMGIENPEVARRWGLELVFNLWALGFALEQKGVAYLFLEVVDHHGLGFLWTGLLPMTGLLAVVLAFLISRERGVLRASPVA
jgi:hypothetical protein